MIDTRRKPERVPRTKQKSRIEPPYNVLLHNDWDNSMTRVVLVLKRTIPGMTLAKATKLMYEAHSHGQAVVKSCHRELAEMYEERLQAEGLTASIDKA
ncbi:ATP-dependent Clp protease adaptor ClpS [Rubrobacter indicoceani]|uniref:ATP-dependent Clp protease adaptor ClpS n=1 Tax=Rubrobacter indicoceani TaxID=2051957 RepID=UPI000E5A839E|nr:ATP-dependent Clp protease adaptor ClpS [Rubrobacter indicoceani]